MTTKQTARDINLAELHHRFQAIQLAVERHGRVYFRHLRCSNRKADAVQEMVGLAWKWYIRLSQQGKDPHQFPSAIATNAARAVRSGRRLTGTEKAKDALSSLAQLRYGFAVSPLPDSSSLNGNILNGNVLDDALQENAVSPVPEQASFRIDFPNWLSTLADRDRDIALDLIAGERTLEVANRHSLSAGRISQMRRLFHQTWRQFHGEPVDAGT